MKRELVILRNASTSEFDNFSLRVWNVTFGLFPELLGRFLARFDEKGLPYRRSVSCAAMVLLLLHKVVKISSELLGGMELLYVGGDGRVSNGLEFRRLESHSCGIDDHSEDFLGGRREPTIDEVYGQTRFQLLREYFCYCCRILTTSVSWNHHVVRPALYIAMRVT